MKIRIPNINDKESFIEGKQSIVLLGANGAGKTRMSVWIDENNPELNVHRISAQKSLDMPEYVSPTELKKAEDRFLYGTTDDDRRWLEKNGKRYNRWGNNPETHMLNDYQPLMEFLMTENFEKSIEYREKHKEGNQEFDNETKLEKIKKIWEKVITHRRLQISAGKIEVESVDGNSDKYNGNAMSDGERAIFHYIAEVVSAKDNSLIIIDEPENHLHNSILERLWNEIEAERQDCVYLYITHNLDFARTRNNTQIVWIKNMLDKQKWDYELLDSNDFSDDLLLEILGNRHGVLFVEGTPDKSIDRKLYSRLFPKYNIIPLEGCASVIQATKAYNKLPMLHYKTIKGIVDRDRRTEGEINSLLQDKIYVPFVAEIENLFLIPANRNLAGAEIELVTRENMQYILKKQLEPIKDNYDFIIIDCPPSLNMLTVNALTAADTVLVPIQCEYYALEGLSQLIYTIELIQDSLNPDLYIEGVVFTMYDARTNLSLQVVENVKDNLKQTIYKTIIPRNVRLAEAPSYGLPINLYDKRSSGTEAYRMLADEVIENAQ